MLPPKIPGLDSQGRHLMAQLTCWQQGALYQPAPGSGAHLLSNPLWPEKGQYCHLEGAAGMAASIPWPRLPPKRCCGHGRQHSLAKTAT